MINLKQEAFIKAIQFNGGQVYFVGGCVRDHLLGLKPKDYDLLVTGMSIRSLALLLEGFGRTDLVGESFGVIKFRPENYVNLELVDLGEFDIAVPRKEIKTGIGHKGFNVITSSEITLKDDLSRRDFTINAMAMDMLGNIIDYFDGRECLKKGILAYISKDAFEEDPLRILRAIRFASVYNMVIADKLSESIYAISNKLKQISLERNLEELKKVFKSSNGDIDMLERFSTLLATYNLKRIVLNSANINSSFTWPYVNSYAMFIFALMVDYDADCSYVAHNYKTFMKGDHTTTKELQSLELLKDAYKAKDDIYVARLLIVEAYKHSNIGDTLVMPKFKQLLLFQNDTLPKNRSQFALDGNTIQHIIACRPDVDNINFGVYTGKVIEAIHRAILFNTIHNNYYDIEWFIKTLDLSKL